ncbi:MAG: hypothetical protein WAX04_12590 [Oscillospiraceae bacterium]
MKSVIVEIRDKFAAALSDDGCITKVKNNNYVIGQVIEMRKETQFKSKKLAIMAVSAAAFVILCGTGAYVYASPYSYVSLDVNPSIEYSLNRFDRVLSVDAVNEDGDKILNEIDLNDLNNKTIDEAMAITVDQLSKDGYFDGDIDGGIVIATSGEDSAKAEELADELQQSVQENTVENGDTVTVEAISVGKERVEKAKELGVTPGKLSLVEKLQASAADPDSIIIGDWLNKPVKEIMQTIKENKQAEKAVTKEKKEPKKEDNKKDEDESTSSSSSNSSSSSATEDTASTTEPKLQENKKESVSMVESEKENSINAVEKEKSTNAVEKEKSTNAVEKENTKNEDTTSIAQGKSQKDAIKETPNASNKKKQ